MTNVTRLPEPPPPDGGIPQPRDTERSTMPETPAEMVRRYMGTIDHCPNLYCRNTCWPLGLDAIRPDGTYRMFYLCRECGSRWRSTWTDDGCHVCVQSGAIQ